MQPSARIAGRRVIATAVAVAAAATALAACGSSSHPTGTAANPASVVPASASVYLGAVVSPEGTLKRNAFADAKTLTGSREPFAAIVKALGSAGVLPHLDYDSEVKPWLGADAGLFVSSTSGLQALGEALGKSLGGTISVPALLEAAEQGLLSAKGAGGALVLDTSDVQRARAFVAKLGKEQSAHSASFDSVTYEVDAKGEAAGIVGRFAVIGSETGLRAVIETHAGGSALSSSAPYAKLAAQDKPSATLLGVYVNDEAVATAASGGEAAGKDGSEAKGAGGAKAGATEAEASAAGGALEGTSASDLLDLLPGEPRQAMLSLLPEARALTVEADLLGSSSATAAKGASASASAAKLVGELPSGSWLALGAGEAGAHLEGDLGALDEIASLAGKSLLASFGGPAIEGLAGKLRAEPAAVERVFGGWAGAAGVFVAGNGLLELQAGLVLDSSAPARSRAAVAKLGALLKTAGASVSPATIAGAEAAESVKVSGLPLALDVGAGNGRFALGLGPASVQAALAAEGGLASSQLYKEASSTVGGEPVLLLDVPTLVGFVEGLGLSESPSLSGVLPDLRSLGELAGGWQQLGGSITRLHLVLGLAK